MRPTGPAAGGLLTLLVDAAEDHPPICLVDDEQWLDRASAEGRGVADGQRLCPLVRQTGPVRDRTVEIEFLDAGAEAFVFTFGQGDGMTFGQLKAIEAGPLVVGYTEDGPADGPAVLLLHGWPYDIHAFAEVTPLLAAAGHRVVVPYLRGHGTTRFRSDAAVRNGEQAALATDAVDLLDALGIERAVLAGFDWGARTADVVAALWPQRCSALVAVSGYLIGSQEVGRAPLPPAAELSWWYQFYFATERGRAGYDRYRREFARLIWHTASPRWSFDDATFDRSAAAFDNPDHVAIVVHNYRWRLGLADGEEEYAAVEKQLAAGPSISVPTITMEGDANGAPHPDPASYGGKFTGPYEHRTIGRGVGHNLPQEAPAEFARAILDVAG